MAEVLDTDVALEVVVCPEPEAPVRWVATNEMPDPRPFLEGNELLLFTGLEMAGWAAPRWRRYVEFLREARVAALGIATGLTHAEVPGALRQACAELGLNLIAVPMETSFVSISQAVAGLLEDRDRTAAREAVALQRRLAQAARRRDAANAIADELARYVRGTVWVLGPDGRTISETARVASSLEEIRSEVATLVPRGLGASASWSSPYTATVVQPIGLREPPEAYVAVRTRVPLTEYERTAVLSSLSLLSLELERRLEQRESARALRRRAFDLLLEGEVRAAELVLSAADPERGRQPRLLPRSVKVMLIRGPQEELRRLLGRAEEDAHQPGAIAALAPAAGELHLLSPTASARTWAEHLWREGLTAGIGGAVEPGDVARGLRTAGLAADQATTGRPIVAWEDFGDSGLAALVAPPARAAFAEDLLGRLDGTATGRPELTRIATSFIRNHGRVHLVAKEIGMHRNTVRTRVREIEAAIGANLDDPTARFNLWAALQIVGGRES